MTYVTRLDTIARRWWPFLASFAAVAVIATMGYVTLSVAEDRAQKTEALAASEKRNDQLAAIIEAERESQETRDERLADAVSQVRQVLTDIVAKHDAQVNRLFQRQLAQIGELLSRPQGTPPDPVTARPQAPAPAPAPSPPRSSATSPGVTSSPTTAAPAPTTPRQKSCERRPNGPHC